MSETYRVRVQGVKEGFTLEQAVTGLADLFKRPEPEIRKIFAAKRVVIKDHMDLLEARKYHLALEQRGCACLIEPDKVKVVDAPAAVAPSAEAGLVASSSNPNATVILFNSADEPEPASPTTPPVTAPDADSDLTTSTEPVAAKVEAAPPVTPPVVPTASQVKMQLQVEYGEEVDTYAGAEDISAQQTKPDGAVPDVTPAPAVDFDLTTSTESVAAKLESAPPVTPLASPTASQVKVQLQVEYGEEVDTHAGEGGIFALQTKPEGAIPGAAPAVDFDLTTSTEPAVAKVETALPATPPAAPPAVMAEPAASATPPDAPLVLDFELSEPLGRFAAKAEPAPSPPAATSAPLAAPDSSTLKPREPVSLPKTPLQVQSADAGDTAAKKIPGGEVSANTRAARTEAKAAPAPIAGKGEEEAKSRFKTFLEAVFLFISRVFLRRDRRLPAGQKNQEPRQGHGRDGKEIE